MDDRPAVPPRRRGRMPYAAPPSSGVDRPGSPGSAAGHPAGADGPRPVDPRWPVAAERFPGVRRAGGPRLVLAGAVLGGVALTAAVGLGQAGRSPARPESGPRPTPAVSAVALAPTPVGWAAPTRVPAPPRSPLPQDAREPDPPRSPFPRGVREPDPPRSRSSPHVAREPGLPSRGQSAYRAVRPPPEVRPRKSPRPAPQRRAEDRHRTMERRTGGTERVVVMIDPQRFCGSRFPAADPRYAACVNFIKEWSAQSRG